MKLDLNCQAEYFQSFLSQSEALDLYQHLITFQKLKNKFCITMQSGEKFEESFGKLMFIDQDLFEGNRFPPSIWGANEVWSDKMDGLRNRILKETGHSYETCVCIYYPDGSSGVDYHSDASAFGDTTFIPSISLGAERVFHLREKSTQIVHDMQLHNGSLLMMGDGCQELFEHALPINLNCKEPRINITFRKYGYEN